ncbi:MAG TPA: hypothetical protein DDZ80_32770 [Cyanobacteria bacterium UBA8803]|nr:hypothetical protein [Cyanobacteria bacterium UBA8803]
MSDKKPIDQVVPGFSDGFPYALRFWLIFLLSLVLLGYSVPFSIVLGAIGGFGGGWIVAWWKSKDEPSKVTEEEPEEPEVMPTKVRGLTVAKQQRESRIRKRSQKRQTALSGFLRR